MLKKYSILIIGFLTSFSFWFLEAIIDMKLEDLENLDIVPIDFNELWMRSLVVILIMAMSFYVHISQAKTLKIERDKSQLQEQLLDEQYKQMELILSTRKQTQQALQNFNKSVQSLSQQIEDGEVLSEDELKRLLSMINAVQNKLDRLWS